MLAEVIGVTVKMKWGVDPGPRPLFTPMRARVPLPACGCVLESSTSPLGWGQSDSVSVRLPDRLRQSDCQTDSDSPTARPGRPLPPLLRAH